MPPPCKTAGKSEDDGARDTKVNLVLAVKHIVNLNIDLSGIPTEEMIRNKGTAAHYVVDFDIEMTLDSAKLSFSMFYKGKRQDTVHADFD